MKSPAEKWFGNFKRLSSYCERCLKRTSWFLLETVEGEYGFFDVCKKCEKEVMGYR